MLRTGIAWTSDKEIKFRNPYVAAGQTLKDGKPASIFPFNPLQSKKIVRNVT